MPALPIDHTEIVVTASRTPEPAAQAAASVTIIDSQRIERLGEPLVPALLRLLPSTAVTANGPSGTLTEVRIRGAEANHTLLFIDGIRANDPAAGNTPRFELLTADLASRIEAVRGPQSALWGSEAVGGVIAVDGRNDAAPGLSALAEGGSFGFRRAALDGSAASNTLSVAAAAGWQASDGIDIFGGGDRDGYRNASGRVRAYWRPSATIGFGASGFATDGYSEFDGNDPVTFARTQQLTSKSRLSAGRIWADLGDPAAAGLAGSFSASTLGSANRNFFAGDPINRTDGSRMTLAGQVQHRFATGQVQHLLIGAAELERETFKARDTVYFGGTNQDQRRTHRALTVEWRGTAGPIVGDVAVRRDSFDRFKDSTTLRASLTADLGHGLSLAGSYGEGIAQPTFFDLFGFFPGSFVGNPSLRPERSRGGELSARFHQRGLSAALTWYRQRLKDEIVGTFDPATFISGTVNGTGASRRSGWEAELAYALDESLRISANYAFLDATEPGTGAVKLREARRPKHSGAVVVDGLSGKLSYGASLSFSGTRGDTAFDVPPFGPVRLHSYWLVGARVGYRVMKGVELFARAANAFDARYQDVFDYRTEGRSVYAGLRLTGRD